MVEKDLKEHYRALKQFLAVSGDQGTRSKSSRALRAREKLVKLTSTQFKELSTDVYDELKRRIDESKSEPDYLLPKSTFHAKRNQARQKLSTLPQTRFKDLVSDISSEIERRGLHSSPTDALTGNSSFDTSFDSSVSRSAPAPVPTVTVNESRSAGEEESQDHEDNHDKSADSAPGMINQTLQSTVVVPKTANVAWSSDEEERGEKEEKEEKERNETNEGEDNEEHLHEETEANNVNGEREIRKGDENFDTRNILDDRSIQGSRLSQKTQESKDLVSESKLILQRQLDSLNEKLNYVESEKNELESKYTLLKHGHQELEKENQRLNSEIQGLLGQRETISLENEKLKRKDFPESSRSIGEPQSELERNFEALKASNAGLRLENQSLKNTPSGRHGERTPSRSSSDRDFLRAKSTGDPELKKKLDLFLHKISDTESPRSDDNTIEQKEIKKGESSELSQRISKQVQSLSTDRLRLFVSPTGLVSIKLVSELNILTEDFLEILNSDKKDTDALFDKISRISHVANQIATQGDYKNNNSNDKVVYLRGAICHALDATRYFALYPGILPRIVVEKAAGEINFIVCDLISVVKLNENSRDSESIDETAISVPRLSLNIRNKANTNIVDTEIQGKPLKMANKLKLAYTPEQLPVKDSEKYNKTDKTYEDNSSFDRTTDHEATSKNGQRQFEGKPIPPRIATSRRGEPEEQPSPLELKSKVLNPFANSNYDEEDVPRRLKALDKVNQFNNSSDNVGDSKGTTGITKQDTLSQQLANTDDQSNSQDAYNNLSKGSLSSRTRAFFSSLKGRSASKNYKKDNEQKAQNANGQHTNTDIDAKNEVPESKDENQRQLTEHDTGRIEKETDSDIQDKSVDPSPITNDSNEETEILPKKVYIMSKDLEDPNPDINDNQQFSEDNLAEKPELKRSESVKPEEEEITPPKKIEEDKNDQYPDSDYHSEVAENGDDFSEVEAKKRQVLRKSMAAATFNVDMFDIDDPNNSLTQVLLYLEHQTVKVISTIQSLLSAIKKQDASKGELREKSQAILEVISQMTDATNNSMNQTRNRQLKEHGSWIVRSLEDCNHRMSVLCRPMSDKQDKTTADRSFKQRLAGISFDIAKCIKELVKTVEESSIKEEITNIDARLNAADDLR